MAYDGIIKGLVLMFFTCPFYNVMELLASYEKYDLD